MLRSAMNVSPDEKVDEEPEFEESSSSSSDKSNDNEEVDADSEPNKDVSLLFIIVFILYCKFTIYFFSVRNYKINNVSYSLNYIKLLLFKFASVSILSKMIN